jgi:hypothetical protein
MRRETCCSGSGSARLNAVNLFQRVNVTATFAALSTNAIGLAHGISQDATAYEFAAANIYALWIILFSIMLRVKICFDDHYSFNARPTNRLRDYWTLAGFLIGLISWATWIVSGSLSYNPRYSAFWLAITILILTVWLLSHLIFELCIHKSSVTSNTACVASDPSPSMTQRALWLIINLSYFVLLALFALFNSSRTYAALGGDRTVVVALFVLLLLDFGFISRERIARVGYES